VSLIFKEIFSCAGYTVNKHHFYKLHHLTLPQRLVPVII